MRGLGSFGDDPQGDRIIPLPTFWKKTQLFSQNDLKQENDGLFSIFADMQSRTQLKKSF